jgi:hypothetical protein
MGGVLHEVEPRPISYSDTNRLVTNLFIYLFWNKCGVTTNRIFRSYVNWSPLLEYGTHELGAIFLALFFYIKSSPCGARGTGVFKEVGR